MAENKQPVVIEHEPTEENSQDKKSSYVKDSASRISSIAQQHGIDALLHRVPPESI